MNQKSTDYRIISPLAIGGMAKVDLAENIETSDQVVFKRIRTDFKLREDMQELFKEEQKLNRHLKSPHVVRMIADGTDEGGPYMIFEWVDGTDLEQILAGVSAKENPLPLNQALLISYYIAQGLAYLHGLQNEQGGNLGLIHRDLSPGNILISNQGEVKIADFGIAKSVIKETQTVVGELKGKFAYMAPEQTRGDTMDQRVDLFALGIVMWECCMAQSLFDAKNNMDVVQRVRERQAPTLITLRNEVPEELSNLVHELLEKDADRRPANIQEVVERLEQIVYAQGLFDGHKRILAQLARQYPRNISFDHVPSGGETQKVTTEELKKPQNIVVKDIPEAMAPIATQVVASNSKGLFVIGLGIMALLGVLIGLNLSSSEAKLPAPPAARTKVKPTAIAPSNPPIEIATPTSVPTPTPQTVQSPKLKKKSTVPPKKPPAAAGFGTFQLTSSPWGWVEIDGKKLEKHTPIRGLQISSGEHQVRIFNPELELERVFKINVRANEKLQKKVNLSTGTIR